MRARRLHGEEGVSIILALGFLALFAAIIPALLDLGTTSLLTTSRLHDQRAEVYAADGATDAAIQFLRTNPSCGRTGASCGQMYSVTLNNKTATTTITPGAWDSTCVAPNINGSTPACHNVILSTSVNGTVRVVAKARIWDNTTGLLPVDVLTWVYHR